VQEGGHPGIEEEFGLNLHGKSVACFLAVLVDVGVFGKDVVNGSAAEAATAEETDPEAVGLVALFAEGDNWGLLVVAAKGAGVEFPALEAVPVEVVPAKYRNYLPSQLLQTDAAAVPLLTLHPRNVAQSRTQKHLLRRYLLLILTILFLRQLSIAPSFGLVDAQRHPFDFP
jgi:hypothetical protein